MQPNIGRTDRIIRLVLGAIIIGIGLYLQSTIGLIGLLPIITALAGWCPSYLPFGISTCKEEDRA
jgi:hypothetical protein